MAAAAVDVLSTILYPHWLTVTIVMYYYLWWRRINLRDYPMLLSEKDASCYCSYPTLISILVP